MDALGFVFAVMTITIVETRRHLLPQRAAMLRRGEPWELSAFVRRL